MNQEPVDTLRTREISINAEVSVPETSETKSRPCMRFFACSLKIMTVLVLISAITVLVVYWSNGRTLLGEFSFQKNNIRTPVFIGVEALLAVTLLISLINILRGILIHRKVQTKRQKMKYRLLRESEYYPYDEKSYNSIGNLLLNFSLGSSLKHLDFKALAEIGLLAKKGGESVVRQAEGSRSANDDEYHCKLASGIAVQPNGGHETCQQDCITLQTRVLIIGTEGAGKTSIFHRLMYGGFSEGTKDTIGLNSGLKTLTIEGPNMFNEHKKLNIQIQIIDACSEDEAVLELLLRHLRKNHVIIILVLDASDMSSVESTDWQVALLKTRSLLHSFIAIFLNKADKTESVVAETSADGIEVLQVSAKSGDRVTESFVRVICKAVGMEAQNFASGK